MRERAKNIGARAEEKCEGDAESEEKGGRAEEEREMRERGEKGTTTAAVALRNGLSLSCYGPALSTSYIVG